MNARIFARWAMAVLVAGCQQIEEVDDEMQGGQVPGRVQEIFDARCNLPGCHGGGVVQENLSLEAESSASIIGRNAQQVAMPLVDIGNVNNSYLAIKILPDQAVMDLGAMRTGVRMPSGVVIDAALQEELAIVLGWIAGADLPGGDVGGTDSGSDGMTADSGSESGTGGEVIQECGIDDLKMGAPNPIVMGTGAMEIPPDIGMILADNCGCHYAEMLDVTTVTDYPEALSLKISTWQEWQAENPTALKPTKEYVLDRIGPMPTGGAMPPPMFEGFVGGCNVGGGETMPPADRQTLIDWIMADTPDGANWMP